MQDIERRGYLFSNQDLLKLILPLVVEQLLAIAVGMADTIMIAAVGEAAVSAISLVDSVNILLINIFTALATGGAVVCGQFLGKRQQKRACLTADQLVLFTTVFAVLIMILLYASKDLILTKVFGKIEADVMEHANIYLLIVAASIPFIALYNCGAALFRTMGNSKVSMMTSLLMNGLNVVGNAILIYGLNMGVVGAAIPTLISRIVAAAVIMMLVRSPKLLVHITRPFYVKPEFKLIKKILYIGIPNGLENSMFQLGKILVLSLVSGFGTASITANAVGNTIATFQILPGMAMGFALITVVSGCVGAGDYTQVRFYTRKLIGIVYGSLWLINVLIFFALPMILRAYHLSEETYGYAYRILVYHAFVCVLIWPLSFTLPNTLRASNDVKFAMTVSVVSMWVFRIGFSFLIARFFGMGVFGVWVAMTIDWLVRGIMFLWRYCGHKWEQHEI